MSFAIEELILLLRKSNDFIDLFADHDLINY